MTRQLVGLHHDLDASIDAAERRHPVVGGARREDRLELAPDLALITDQIARACRSTDRGIEREPELGLERADREVAIVLRAIDSVRREAAGEIDSARGMRAARLVAELGDEQRHRA